MHLVQVKAVSLQCRPTFTYSCAKQLLANRSRQLSLSLSGLRRNFIHCNFHREIMIPFKAFTSGSSIVSQFCAIYTVEEDVASTNFFYVDRRTGKNVSPGAECENGQQYWACPRCLGGKGGFGSMLRAMGKQIEKTTNKEAMRDLTGRRVRDINAEQRLREWNAKQADRERRKQERKRQRQDRLLGVNHKHDFKDNEYEENRVRCMDSLDDALKIGLSKKTQSHQKAKAPTSDSDSSDVSSSDDAHDLANVKKQRLELDEIPTVCSSSIDPGKHEVAVTKNVDVEQSTQCGVNEGTAAETKLDEKFPDVDLNSVTSIDVLLRLGLDHLKAELKRRGQKCGGTLEQRANRLYSLKK